MKVIFLDIDGVLNYEGCPVMINGIYFVDDERIRLLKSIIDRTGARIVLSSTWRYGKFLKDDSPREYRLFKRLKKRLEEHEIYITSYTPVFDYEGRAYRGDEISAWLEGWKGEAVDKFIILDDNDDIEPYSVHLIQTSWQTGLTSEDVEKAVMALE